MDRKEALEELIDSLKGCIKTIGNEETDLESRLKMVESTMNMVVDEIKQLRLDVIMLQEDFYNLK